MMAVTTGGRRDVTGFTATQGLVTSESGEK